MEYMGLVDAIAINRPKRHVVVPSWKLSVLSSTVIFSGSSSSSSSSSSQQVAPSKVTQSPYNQVDIMDFRLRWALPDVFWRYIRWHLWPVRTWMDSYWRAVLYMWVTHLNKNLHNVKRQKARRSCHSSQLIFLDTVMDVSSLFTFSVW